MPQCRASVRAEGTQPGQTGHSPGDSGPRKAGPPPGKEKSRGGGGSCGNKLGPRVLERAIPGVLRRGQRAVAKGVRDEDQARAFQKLTFQGSRQLP